MGNSHAVEAPKYTVCGSDLYDIGAIGKQSHIAFKGAADKWEDLLILVSPPGYFGLFAGSVTVSNFWGKFYYFLPLWRKYAEDEIMIELETGDLSNGNLGVRVYDSNGTINERSFPIKEKVVVDINYQAIPPAFLITIDKGDTEFILTGAYDGWKAKYNFSMEYKHDLEDIVLGSDIYFSLSELDGKINWKHAIRQVRFYGEAKGFKRVFNDIQHQLNVLQREKATLERHYHEVRLRLSKAQSASLHSMQSICIRIDRLEKALNFMLWKPRLKINVQKHKLDTESAAWATKLDAAVEAFDTLNDDLAKIMADLNRQLKDVQVARDHAYSIKLTAFNDKEEAYSNWQYLCDHLPSSFWIPIYGPIKWKNDCDDLKDLYQDALDAYQKTVDAYQKAEDAFEKEKKHYEEEKKKVEHASQDVKDAQNEVEKVKNEMETQITAAIASLDALLDEVKNIKHSDTCLQLKAERDSLHSTSAELLNDIGTYQSLQSQIDWLGQEISKLQQNHVVHIEDFQVYGTVDDLSHKRLMMKCTGTRGGKKFTITAPYILASPNEIFGAGRFDNTHQQNTCSVFYAVLGMFSILVSPSLQGSILQKFLSPEDADLEVPVPDCPASDDDSSWDSEEL